ncbi:MFS transporter [Amycolatopsis thermophila]|uniref:MFS family permease n=1 Tax=Amycolatopsis thermophila TaxID=206084 RepID=A0ABU0F5M8_9PSEU|nr:MFS transporter [Amycolatopsis thermophila]MDQ0382890.1 MFS family permease [Amycolatopsis thermophila]
MGIVAPILLTLLRLLQGLAGGGEWGGAVLMSLQHYSSSRWRAVPASVPQIGVGLGIALATASFAALTGYFDDAALFGWARRIPFLASSVLVGVAIWIRLGIDESPIFKAAQEKRRQAKEKERLPIIEVFRKHPGTLAIGILLVIGPYTAKTILNSFGPAYAVEVGFSRSTALSVASATALLSLPIPPLAATWSESIGRKKVYILGAALTGIASFVTFWLANTGVYGVQSSFLAELFGAKTQYTGTSFAYQVGGVVGGGFGPAIAASLLAFSGGAPNNLLFGFMALCCVASVVAAVLAKETRRRDLTEE